MICFIAYIVYLKKTVPSKRMYELSDASAGAEAYHLRIKSVPPPYLLPVRVPLYGADTDLKRV